MIDEFFILRKDGLNLFHIILEKDSYAVQVPTELFAGFSSAMVAFANELGSGQLSKIEIEDQIFVFNLSDKLITVAKISTDDDEHLAKHIVALLEREFINDYREELKNFRGTVRKDVFFPFSEKVHEIIKKCMKVAAKNPHLLENIPPSIDIDAILTLSEYSDELIENFPDATIRLTREFHSKLPEGEMHYTMFKLGLEVGKEVAKKKFNNRQINDKEIMKLLKEISICSMNDNVISLQICPFCRGRKTKEFDCDFVSGFIEGAYNNPNIAVREINCHAVGHKHCEFQVYKI
ncbi:MAG: V4R domain-containing protein [Candidatus Heimdallarchaeota archaeon]